MPNFEMEKAIQNRRDFATLKSLSYVFQVKPMQKDWDDASLGGATMHASSLIRKPYTLQRLRELGFSPIDIEGTILIEIRF